MAIIEHLPRLTSPTDYSFKVILTGEKGSGKTSLLNRIVNNKYTEDYSPTLISNYMKVYYRVTTKKEVKLVTLFVWDTNGEEKYRSVTKTYFKNTNATLLLYDTTKKESFERTEFWLDLVKEELGSCAFVYLVGSKVDLTGERIVNEDEIDDLVKRNKESIKGSALVSAKSGVGVEKLFEDLVRFLLQIADEPKMPRKTVILSSAATIRHDSCKC